MRNAKKLMLLLLSLALLCGVFAVAALAEEPATEATVVYPDGSTEVVAVGETITPKTFTDGLYYGKGNTLFKDDATEGWTFTVDGAALADLTVTDAMAGKKIIASGADKVYYTSEEIATDDSSKIIYHLTDDVKYYFSSSNLGDKGDGTNTGASHYQDLRRYPDGTEGRNTVKDVVIKLYEDVVAERIYMNWFIDEASRNGGRNAYFDLNGHTVVNNTTDAYLEIKSLAMRIYSSQPGAHWYQPNSTAAFYVSDDATLYLGNNSTGSATYSDNLSVHCKTLFNTMYGNGAAILGGHYYQLEGANTYLVRISRRLSTMQNASFYVQDGNALLGTPDDLSDNLKKATNCKFYSIGESVIVEGEKGIALTFENCAFYGINTEVAEATAKLTLDEACTENAAAEFKTVTFADGTTAKYVANSLEEAKAFVESHPKAAPAQDAKYVGDDYMVRSNPVSVFTYDEAFNATVTVEGEYDAKVYYVIDSVLYGKIFVTKNNLGAYLSKMTHGGATITLYEDATVSATAVKAERVFVNSVNRSYAESAKYFLDLNGHTIKASSSSGTFMDVKAANFYIYSSVPGGVIDAGGHVFFRTNNDDYKWIDGRAYDSDSAKYKEEAYAGYATIVPRASAFMGEDDDDNTAYDQNLTVYCARINTDMYGTNAKLLGGTYVQKGANSANFFMQMGREKSDSSHVYEVKNATFIVSDYDDAMIHLRCNADRTFTNCTFVSLNPAGAPLTSYTEYANTFTFVDCNFVNVLPRLGDAYIVYTNAAFGTTGAYTVDDLDITDEAAQYIAHGTSAKTIEANGKTYRLDGAFITDPAAALKITHEGFGTDYWAIGTTVSVALDEIVKIEGDKIYSGAYYDYSAIDAIEDGVVTKAGEATAPIGFANADELAFSYLDTKTGILYGVSYKECGETAKGVGDKFHELFSVPASAYEITMYKDMVLSKAVSFGPLVKQKDQYNRDYFDSFVNGDIVWDLNGTTVTIDKNVTGLVKLAAANCSTSATDPGNETWTGDTVFGFEGQTAKSGSFTLKSSKAGAQIINESSAKLFGVGEGKYSKLVIYGENLTVTSPKSLIIATIEMNWDVTAVHHQIYGGTYIGGSAEGVLRISRSGSIENATLISTNAGAAQVVVLDGYRSGTINIKNCVFAAENANAVAVGVVGGSQKYTLTLDGCTLANVKATEAGDRYNSVTYTGATVVSNAADLALIYASAPEGKVVAYASVSVNGKAYKVCGYYAAAEVVTVQIPLAGLTELWAAGSEFIAPENNADLSVVEKDGKLYYRANPVWMAKIDGVAVDEILALENAGKTVVLDVEGELEFIYVVRELANGQKSYYYGENAAADVAALLANMGATNSIITFYGDMTLATASNGLIVKSGGENVTHRIDLNGYTITVAHTSENHSYGLYFQNGTTIVYSSKEGGVIDASAADMFWMTDSGANAYVGEYANDGSTAYGKNLTVYCKSLNHSRLWSNNGHILGGTYVQVDGASAVRFIGIDEGPIPTMKNATFIFNTVTESVIRGVCGTFTNCTFIAKNEAELLAKFGSGKDTGVVFNNCYFYNIVPTSFEDVSVTYTDCHFNVSAALASGFVAFGGEKVTLNVNGVDYVFDAALVENAALVSWAYGNAEYWVIGATASHVDVVVDGFFTYGYESFVVEGDAAPEATLKAIADGALQMSLTLQDKIGVNLFFAEALADATVKFGGAEIALADLEVKDGYFKLSTAIAPNLANLDYNVTVVIGENEHVITLSVGTYAEKILATDTYANVHKLTYAMVAYVRAMTGDADFLADVQKPAGYEAQLPGEAAYEKGENTLLTGLRFNLSGTIALELAGAAAKGMEVTLVLANGRTEVATVDENGSAIFVGLYVNDFAGEMEITVGEEVYSYSIENYYNALDAVDSQEAIAALYNYAQYAAAYVELLQNAD